MNEASAAFLAKAERARDAAETLLRERHAELASGRAYYAMFYVAEAMLADGYGFEPALTIEDVRTMLDRAAEFLLAARSWFAAR